MFYVQSSNIYGAVASFSNIDYSVVKGLYDALCGAQDMAYVQLGGVGTGVMEHRIIQDFVPDFGSDETEAFAASLAAASEAGLFDGDEVVKGGARNHWCPTCQAMSNVKHDHSEYDPAN